MSEPASTFTVPPRQRFPTRKQALIIFFGSLVLSFTTCMSVVVLSDRNDISDTVGVLLMMAFYLALLVPVAGFIVMVMYFVRARGDRRQRGAS